MTTPMNLIPHLITTNNLVTPFSYLSWFDLEIFLLKRVELSAILELLLSLPVGHVGPINSPCFILSLCRKLAHRSRVIGLAFHVSPKQHIYQTHFLAKYLNKTHILTCIVKHPNSYKALWKNSWGAMIWMFASRNRQCFRCVSLNY